MRRFGRHWLARSLLCALAVGLVGCGPPPRPVPVAPAAPPPPSRVTPFTATAYSGGGRTASGTVPRSGVVAADPAVLPLGSRIRVQGAGTYSGQYVVRDTGAKIRGRRIDIYIPKHAQAKRFGKRTVKVEVIQYGSVRRVARAHTHRSHRHRSRHRRHRAAPNAVARNEGQPDVSD